MLHLLGRDHEDEAEAEAMEAEEREITQANVEDFFREKEMTFTPVTFDKLGLFGLVEMIIFIATVFIAYAYVWRRGGLEWD